MPPDPTTSTGTDEVLIVSLPSCPKAFNPQHQTAPPVVSVQACDWPLAIAATPVPCPETGAGAVAFVLAPLPIWPEVPAPQHCAAPAEVAAQVKLVPAEIATTPVVSPDTCTGTLD